MTYDEIREQLRDEQITIEQAQELWQQHKETERRYAKTYTRTSQRR